MHARTHARTRARTHTHTHTHARARAHTHTHTYAVVRGGSGSGGAGGLLSPGHSNAQFDGGDGSGDTHNEQEYDGEGCGVEEHVEDVQDLLVVQIVPAPTICSVQLTSKSPLRALGKAGNCALRPDSQLGRKAALTDAPVNDY